MRRRPRHRPPTPLLAPRPLCLLQRPVTDRTMNMEMRIKRKISMKVATRMCNPRGRSTYKHNQTNQNERTFQIVLTFSSCWMQTYRPVASSFNAACAYVPLLSPLARTFAPFPFLCCYAMPLLMLLLLMVLLMMKLTPLGGTNSKKICGSPSPSWRIQHTTWSSAA